jgi:hypothetical protein
VIGDPAQPPHKCEFPVQPPEGSWSHPGDCRRCGKTWAQSQTEQKMTEAQAVIADLGLIAVSRDDLLAVLAESEGFIGGKDNAAFTRLAAAVGVQ